MGLKAIIVYLSFIVWSFPPFRQYKGKFFNYFFIIALGDPLGSLVIRLGYKNNHPVYAAIGAAALLSVIALNKNINRIPAISFFLFTLTAAVFMPLEEVRLMIAAIFLLLTYYFIRHLIIFAGQYGRVSFFHVLFLMYNLSIVFKMVNFSHELQKGNLYFFFTTIFDIVLGILFCIFREEDERFAFKINKSLSY